jgi:hypothetical protein
VIPPERIRDIVATSASLDEARARLARVGHDAFLTRYRELRARGVGETPFDKQCCTDFWRPAVPTPERDETYYVRPATAAAITGLSTGRLAALRRRGRIRSIGMTATEYKRTRELASWGDASGWGPGVWYLREDVERLAREGKHAA